MIKTKLSLFVCIILDLKLNLALQMLAICLSDDFTDLFFPFAEVTEAYVI